MSALAAQQRAFLFVVRPAASLLAAVGLGVAVIVAPDGHQALLLKVVVVVLATAGLGALAGWKLAPAGAIRAGLVIDTALIAAVAVALDAPFRLALGYAWLMGVSAVVLGGLDTVGMIAICLIAVAVTPLAAGLQFEPELLLSTEFGLALLGGALVAATRPARRAQAALAERSAQDAAALEISERIRASLDLDAVLHTAVAELGRSLDAAACSLQLPTTDDGAVRVYHWTRPGDGAASDSTAELAAATLETAAPLVIDDVEEDGLAEQERRMLAARELRSGLGYPIGWRERTVGAVGLACDRPRAWEREAVPLLERLGPQLSAALAQAEAYEQQQRTIATLEQLNAQRQQLVATVSHELRTPVTATLGFLETLLMRPGLSEDERRRFLHEAAAGARRLARLVDDLLVLTRMERRTLPLVRQRLEPAQLLEQALGSLIVLDDREVTLRSDGDCAVAGDPDRLLQVFVNLISNAIIHGQGQITVSCRENGDRVVIAIEDDGLGIPRANVDQLFVPFARFGASEGTGLGLAISRGLAEAHGGSLDYRPARGPHEKHAFVLELPAASSLDRIEARPLAVSR